MPGSQRFQRDVTAQRLTGLDFDAADTEQKVDLPAGEGVDRLVGGKAEFVQTTRLVFRLENRHIVAKHRQPVGAGKPCRPLPTMAIFLPVVAARSKGCPSRCIR